MSYYVTTPIYYVNGEPHLGHAYSTIAADILARHHRQRGEDVFFLTGTDEHGEPVAQQAEREGVTPRELGDRLAPRFKRMAAKVEASNDFFIRTTDEGHVKRVQEVVQRVHDNGHVYEGTYEGLYCPRCADFKTESEVAEGNTCPIHGIELTKEKQDNWFFKLSAFQEDLERLYEERPDFVTPDFRRNEALSFIKQGLRDVSLSRPTLKWGVPVPWDTEQVIYVWFDALLNYYTALGYAREDEDLTGRYWPAFHILAKDILKFHAVYWPAFLMAAELELPRGMFIHGFLLMEGQKMSKSLGNVLDPDEVIEKFGADALRYYCFREVSFGQDGQISPAGFEARYDSELANEFGNLANRTLSMVSRYRASVVPEAEPDPALAPDFEGVPDRFNELLDGAELSQALEDAWKLVRRLNRYVEESRPWDLAKAGPGREAEEPALDVARLDQVLYSLAEGLRVAALLLHSYMPDTTGRLLGALGEPDRGLAAFGSRGGGQAVEKIPPLFPKLEAESGD
ncbi:MAG: methionine--tRNA ligase [Solirubrobacterales bacterium]|nr:methionine--tRNA ligase [Solirubrobacterales bacterium]